MFTDVCNDTHSTQRTFRCNTVMRGRNCQQPDHLFFSGKLVEAGHLPSHKGGDYMS